MTTFAKASAVKTVRLAKLIAKLRSLHLEPEAPPIRDPYHLILWEQVGYLADEPKRLAAYRELEERVGLAPRQILDASDTSLRAVARSGGGIAVAQRANRLRVVAERVHRVWNDNLRPVLKLPLAEARRELKKYPAIGEPGAERILLLCGAHPVLGLDSNALRVLQRLGYASLDAAWAKAYRDAQAAAHKELPRTIAALKRAYLLLKEHGQTICRRSTPRCDECPLAEDCPYFLRLHSNASRAMSSGT